MASQPRAFAVHHLVFLLTVATRAAAGTPITAASAPRAAETPSAAASFLRARCAATLFPALCYDSLLPFAAEVQGNPARLARAAADVAAARIHALAARVKDILQLGGSTTAPVPGGGGAGAGGRPSETAALRDCAGTIADAASLARRSSAELARLAELLDAAGGGTTTTSSSLTAVGSSRQLARWAVSNAKTWLSAAVTNEGTCAQGVSEAGAADSRSGNEVAAGVASVEQYTSNALALVNGIPM